MKNENAVIDLVYLWVDGNDSKWQAKKNAFTGKIEENSSIDCKGRYVSNDELKYSLRSVEKYAPWLNKIYIVTDEQIPDWLDIQNPKIKIIDHKEILPQKSLPCFNSSLLLNFLYKIPGLSEHFLYADDDMFFNKAVFPNTFFAEDGFPIVRLNPKPFRQIRWWWKDKIRKKLVLNYSVKIQNATKLVRKKYGKYYSGLPHHNVDAYLKSDCKRIVEKIFKDEFDATLESHVRNNNDIQRIIFLYAALAEKRGHLYYTTKKDSIYVGIHKENHYVKLRKNNPLFFCMNDSQYANDDDRIKAKEFLKNRFKEKSSFEK